MLKMDPIRGEKVINPNYKTPRKYLTSLQEKKRSILGWFPLISLECPAHIMCPIYINCDNPCLSV